MHLMLNKLSYDDKLRELNEDITNLLDHSNENQNTQSTNLN